MDDGRAPANPFELGTDGPGVIVVGLDGSETSLRAAAYAAGSARRQHARLVIVFVARPGGLASIVPGGSAALASAAEQIAAELRRMARRAARETGVTISFRMLRGDPFRQLCRVADEVRADAVVVGASSRSGHRVAGSLAVRLVRAGRWPVTVVP